MMLPGCSTAITRPGNGPGIPGLVVAARDCDCRAVAAAAAELTRSSRRVIVMKTVYGRAGGRSGVSAPDFRSLLTIHEIPNKGAYLSGSRMGRNPLFRKMCFVLPSATRREEQENW